MGEVSGDIVKLMVELESHKQYAIEQMKKSEGKEKRLWSSQVQKAIVNQIKTLSAHKLEGLEREMATLKRSRGE